MTKTIRADLVRKAGIARYMPHPWPAGHWIFNTHHSVYQAALPPAGKFIVIEPRFIEMTDAQFALWLQRVEQVRSMVREALTSSE